MKQKNNYVVSLIGGHLAPAEAIAEHLHKSSPDILLEFIGRKKTFTSNEYTANSVEKKVMDNYVKKVIELPIERVNFSPRSWFNFVFSILITMRHFLKHRPDCVVSFGGYVANPVCLAAILCKIPLLIHEQTHSLGASNRFFSKFANRVCVSYRELVSGKFVYTGFPLRNEIMNPPEKLSFSSLEDLPILYITGGTTGAVAINKLILPLLPTLVKEWLIIHQTGSVSFEAALKAKSDLKVNEQNRYIPLEFINSKDVSWLLHNAKCVVSRSGANIVYELAYTKTPSVLIPLANSSQDEQHNNAEWLEKYAPRVVLKQENANPNDLLQSISNVLVNKNSKIVYESVPTNGVENIVFEIRTLLT